MTPFNLVVYTIASIFLGWTLSSLNHYRIINNLRDEISNKDETIRNLRQGSNTRDPWRM